MGSLPRGSSGLLNILPMVGEKRQNLEVKVRPAGALGRPRGQGRIEHPAARERKGQEP